MRLIDADALKTKIEEMQAFEPKYAFHFLNDAQNPSTEWECVEDLLENAPTIDAEPVRHGRWVRRKVPGGARMFVCGACNSVAQSSCSNYCCDCGAKMDLRAPTEVQLDEADSVMMGEVRQDATD